MRLTAYIMRLPLQPILLAGAACLIAIVAYVHAFVHKGLPLWPNALAASISHVLPAALLGWGVWRFTVRDRGSRRWGWIALEHVGAACVFCLLWTSAVFGQLSMLHPEAAAHYWTGVGAWEVLLAFPVYGMIAGVAVAVQSAARLRERELAVTRAELQALRAQLDPHFLFNTLHTLTVLVRSDPAVAEDALERFGDLLRYVLETNRTGIDADVALADELTFLRNYLALERLRFGERLRTAEDIDPDALDCAVPPLLLQPLVENAVRHGIAPLRRGGTLRINAQCNDQRLALEIADDGAGARPEQWERAPGIGLQVVQRRLNARFPGRHSFAVKTWPDGGFMVRLSIPLVDAVPTNMPLKDRALSAHA